MFSKVPYSSCFSKGSKGASSGGRPYSRSSRVVMSSVSSSEAAEVSDMGDIFLGDVLREGGFGGGGLGKRVFNVGRV